MKLRTLLTTVALIGCSGAALAWPPQPPTQLDLTPWKNHYREQLPSGHYDIDFTATWGDWMDRVRLPDRAVRTQLYNDAGSGRNLEIVAASMKELPVQSLVLPPGEGIGFTHDETGPQGHWPVYTYRELQGPNTRHWTIPWRGRELVTLVTLRNGAHAEWIELPYEPRPYDTVTIHNRATNPSQVYAKDTTTPGTQLILYTGDVHHYVFEPSAGKWRLAYATGRDRQAGSGDSGH